jgi:hypothetical protein
MIRKPPADWAEQAESAAVRTVRTANAVAVGGAKVARSGKHAMVGVMSFFFAALWGFVGLAHALKEGLPSFIGIGAMVAFASWWGCRSFAKARRAMD